MAGRAMALFEGAAGVGSDACVDDAASMSRTSLAAKVLGVALGVSTPAEITSTIRLGVVDDESAASLSLSCASCCLFSFLRA